MSDGDNEKMFREYIKGAIYATTPNIVQRIHSCDKKCDSLIDCMFAVKNFNYKNNYERCENKLNNFRDCVNNS